MAKLYFRYGAMNSGKSTALIQVAFNYEQRGMKAILIKPSIDTKGGDKVVNRTGYERKVDYLISRDDNILEVLDLNNLPDAILIDEAQFLTPKQVDELYRITKLYDVPVLAYGLRANFQQEPFEGSPRLLLIADSIEELKTICRCGKKATQNMRLLNGKPVFEGDAIYIDGSGEFTYESVCGECYLKIKDEALNNNK